MTFSSMAALNVALFVLTGFCAAQPPNIVWLIADDVSPDLGCYGRDGIKTPNLDQLAREGVELDDWDSAEKEGE